MAKRTDSEQEHQGLKTFIVRDLEQAKLLADPLRLKILQAFAAEPRTTKQVAEFLGESPTKLYRHVDALHEASLLELREKRPKRGTVEKYFAAVAHKFVIDPTLFLPNDKTEFLPKAEEFMQTIMYTTLEELKQVKDYMESDKLEILPLIVRAQIKAPPEKITELLDLLNDWVDTVQNSNVEESEEVDEADMLSWAATVALYPLIESNLEID